MSIYTPYGGTKDRVYLKARRLFNRFFAIFSKYPNVFLVNLQNSGSSAIDPILRELFGKRWYYLTAFGPEGSDYVDWVPHFPFYHWSHSSPSQFRNFLGNRGSKFIYLHRDPRDVAVSWAHDMLKQNTVPGTDLHGLIKIAYQGNLRVPSQYATDWLQQDCLIIRFEELKTDMKSVLKRICNYVGIDDMQDSELSYLIEKYSFESMTGRKRGDDGPTIRTGYMHRKGISGEWKNHFDPEMRTEFKGLYGDLLIRLGYERDLNW